MVTLVILHLLAKYFACKGASSKIQVGRNNDVKDDYSWGVSLPALLIRRLSLVISGWMRTLSREHCTLPLHPPLLLNVELDVCTDGQSNRAKGCENATILNVPCVHSPRNLLKRILSTSDKMTPSLILSLTSPLTPTGDATSLMSLLNLAKLSRNSGGTSSILAQVGCLIKLLSASII